MHDHESDPSTSSLWIRLAPSELCIKQYKTYNSGGLSKLSKHANELFPTTKDNDPGCSNDSSRTATDRQGAIDNESNCRFVSRPNTIKREYSFKKIYLTRPDILYNLFKTWENLEYWRAQTFIIMKNDRH